MELEFICFQCQKEKRRKSQGSHFYIFISLNVLWKSHQILYYQFITVDSILLSEWKLNAFLSLPVCGLHLVWV